MGAGGIGSKATIDEGKSCPESLNHFKMERNGEEKNIKQKNARESKSGEGGEKWFPRAFKRNLENAESKRTTKGDRVRRHKRGEGGEYNNAGGPQERI